MLKPSSVVGLSAGYAKGEHIPPHHHPYAQLIYACEGVMQVHTKGASWLVPPTQAIWIPPHIEHWIHMRGPVEMRTLYLTEVGFEWAAHCYALHVPPLLKELILHMVAIQKLCTEDQKQARLIGLLSDLIAAEEDNALEVPMPTDSRALNVANQLLRHEDFSTPLAQLVVNSGASMRTIQRLFLKETQLSLQAWKQRARMHRAVVLLSNGMNVTNVAQAVGYQSASAFIDAFKEVYSKTPTQFLTRKQPQF